MRLPSGTSIRGLAMATHPLPSVAVTTMMAVLVAAAGNDAQTVVIATLAVLTGQLSIGWSNDSMDAARDADVGRGDKPLAAGAVSRRTVWLAAFTAATATVPLSLALGWRSGLVHLGGVACGWLYNTSFKSSALSPLPFAIAFGGLPAVATLALPSHHWPPGWALLAGALIGVAAHFANVLPDLEDDRRTGVIGLPHRIGRVWSTAAATASGVAAAFVVGLRPGAPDPLLRGVLTFAAVACAAVALVAVRCNARSEAAFHGTMLIAAIDVALIAASHSLG